MAINDSDLFVVGTNNGRTVKSATGRDVKDFLSDEFVNVSGDTVEGELNVQYPTEDDHASSKEYVDEEIFKIRSELEDIASDIGNGSFQLKNPGSFQPPADGEFALYDGSFSTLTVADADLIVISNTNREGEYQSLADAEGGYIRFRIAGTDREVVYAVNSIPFSNTAYTQLEVVLHSASHTNLSVNSVAYVNTIRIQGIDLNDLEQELDARYVKLVGDSDIVGDIQIGTSPGSMNITLDNTGDITAKSFTGDGANLENLPKQEVVHFGPAPSDPQVGDLWWTDVFKATHFELYCYAEYEDKDDGSLTYDWFPVTSHERFPSTYVSEDEPDKQYFKKGDLWLKESTSELHVLNTAPVAPGPPEPYEFVFHTTGTNSPYEIGLTAEQKPLLDELLALEGLIYGERPGPEDLEWIGEVSGASDLVYHFVESGFSGTIAMESHNQPPMMGYINGEDIRIVYANGDPWPINPESSTASTDLEWVLVSGGVGGDFMPLDLNTLDELP